MNQNHNPSSDTSRACWNGSRWLLILAVLLGCQFTAEAAKILFVQREGRRDTAKFVDILRAQGHAVTVHDTDANGNAGTAASYAAQGYHLLIADEVISSSGVGSNWRNSPIPVINWEAYLYSGNRSAFNADSGLAGGNYPDVATANAANAGAGADYGQIMGETAINITATGHPLAAGFSGSVALWNTGIDTNKFPVPPETNPDGQWQGVASFMGTRTMVPGVTKIAEVPGGSSYWTLFCVEPGVVTGTTTNQARWIHLPWNDTLEGRVMQEPSFFLFEAAVAYALSNSQPTKIHNLTEPAVFAPTNTLITFSVDKTTAGGSAVLPGDIGMAVNGVSVTGTLVITDGGTRWNVSYTGGFATNAVSVIVASATAADGGFSARKTTLDTFNPGYFTVEAEDYNYADSGTATAGLFFDNPMLCTNIGGGIEGCYFDRISSNAVDRFKGNTRLTINTPANVEVYRFGSGFAREETMDTTVSWDWAVQGRSERVSTGIADYEVRNIGQNDWQNYTRTYPVGKFNVYLRMQTSGTNCSVQLDLVNDPVSPSTTNKLGRFVSQGVAGGELIPLTDDSGSTLIVVELTSSAPSTLRLTQLSPGYHMQGYFLLVPSSAEVNNPPSVSIDGPADRANVNEGDSVNFSATATDDGTITGVEFFVNDVSIGTATTPPYGMNWKVPALGGIRTDYIIKAVVTDDGSLTGESQIKVFAADPAITRLTPDADASFVEVNGTTLDTGAGGNASLAARTAETVNEVSALRFDLNGLDLASVQELALNLVNQRNNASRTLHFYGVIDGSRGGDNNGKVPGWTDNTWDEADTNNNLAFSTMSGLIFDGIGGLASQGINPNDTVDLGAVTLSPTDKDSLFTFTSAALTSFLADNPDALATILVANDEDSTTQVRLASKEQTSLDGGSPTGSAGDFAPFLSFRVGGPELIYTRDGTNLTFEWSGNFKLQFQTNALSTGITTSWSDYPGGETSGVVVPIQQTQETVMFRIAPR